jgi:hypothetical protein
MAIVTQEETTAKIKQMVCDVIRARMERDGLSEAEIHVALLLAEARARVLLAAQLYGYVTQEQAQAIIQQVIAEKGVR